VDTRAEVNVITAKLAATARLPIHPKPNIAMVSHTGHKRHFTSVCDNVTVLISRISLTSHFFVLEDAEH